MKASKFFGFIAASAIALAGCSEKEEAPAAPSLSVDPATVSFETAGGSSSVTIVATRDWTATSTADWVSIEPASGKGSNDDQQVTVTVLSNSGTDRTAEVKFSIGFDDKVLTVAQAGEAGSAEAAIVYKNDFDKEVAAKTYGSGSSWPYLDQFDGWKNASGAGIGSETYAFSGVSARANSTSNGNFADYAGSGNNNLFFGSGAYFSVSGLTLGDARNYTLSFGAEKYSQDGNSVFSHSEFHVYVGDGNGKWVELEYAFAKGTDPEGRWDLASSSFTLPAATTALNIYVKADVASVYRLDDLSLTISSEAGTAIDFSKGVDLGGDSGSGDTPGTGSDDKPAGDGSLASPYNAKAAYDAAAALAADAVSADDVYVKGIISSITYTFSAQYGTATFNISEDGAKTGTQFTCYSVLYLGNKSWTDGDAQVAVGDQVVVCGKLTNYGGNTPETASRKAYIYSLNGKTSIEQENVFKVESDNIAVDASATSATIKVIGNVAWTASSSNATISPTSGEGAGEITVSFDANTSTENSATYTVVVSTTADVATKSYTVTITQNKVSAAGEVSVSFDKKQLAAAACKDAVVKMDDVISFTNSSDYGTNTVTELRIYKSSKFKVSAADGYVITGIEFECTASGTTKQGPGCFGTGAPTGYTYSGKNGQWAGSASSVEFNAVDNQVRVVSLTVKYIAK